MIKIIVQGLSRDKQKLSPGPVQADSQYPAFCRKQQSRRIYSSQAALQHSKFNDLAGVTLTESFSSSFLHNIPKLQFLLGGFVGGARFFLRVPKSTFYGHTIFSYFLIWVHIFKRIKNANPHFKSSNLYVVIG